MSYMLIRLKTSLTKADLLLWEACETKIAAFRR